MNQTTQTDRVFFGQDLEPFFTVVRDKLSPSQVTAIKALGMDPTKKLGYAYSAKVVEEVVRVVATGLFPNVTESEAFHSLGKMNVEAYQHSFFGKALFPLLRLVSKKRFLDKFSRQVTVGNNFIKSNLVEKSPDEFQIWVNYALGNPSFLHGMLEATLKASGHRDVRITLEAQRDGECTYRVLWGADAIRAA